MLKSALTLVLEMSLLGQLISLFFFSIYFIFNYVSVYVSAVLPQRPEEDAGFLGWRYSCELINMLGTTELLRFQP